MLEYIFCNDFVPNAQCIIVKCYDFGSQIDVLVHVLSCRQSIWGFEMGSANGFYTGEEFNLETKWLIDPKLLFVGPKIGEGAHAKVYEGK